MTFLLMGTVEEGIAASATKIVFEEDLKASEKGLASALPPGLPNLGNTCYLNASVQVSESVCDMDVCMCDGGGGGWWWLWRRRRRCVCVCARARVCVCVQTLPCHAHSLTSSHIHTRMHAHHTQLCSACTRSQSCRRRSHRL
jgi:hypothetical protein